MNRPANRTFFHLGLLVCLCSIPLTVSANSSKISGVVVDPLGTPQMGATVMVLPEQVVNFSSLELRTNDHGQFSSGILPAGLYSIKVTLAGFLPATQAHVQVDERHAALLEVAMGSLFSSVEKLRRQPGQESSGDDWAWVLRASASTRSVLQWQDGPIGLVNRADANSDANQGRLVVSSGANHPGSIANNADSPGTALVYDMGIGRGSQLLMAGQFSHEKLSSAGAFAAQWLLSGILGEGPVTTLVVRQSQMGPGGLIFRGVRMSHESQFSVGDLLRIRYGGEYVAATLGKTTQTVRPHAEAAVQISKNWQATAMVATHPWQTAAGDSSALQTTLDSLDAFPTVMIRHHSPVLENNLHEELGIQHTMNNGADISAAVFHDQSKHTAVIGTGPAVSSDFLQDYFSTAFAYDGGGYSSTGARVAYRQTIASNVTTSFVYSYDGALAPNMTITGQKLRNELTPEYRHSAAARVTATAPALGTKITTSYKWISGPTASRQDPYGEALYQTNPYLNVEIRQPLPSIFPRHMEVDAAMGNVLAQGYVTMATKDGHVVVVPAYRYFRGGFTFQF